MTGGFSSSWDDIHLVQCHPALAHHSESPITSTASTCAPPSCPMFNVGHIGLLSSHQLVAWHSMLSHLCPHCFYPPCPLPTPLCGHIHCPLNVSVEPAIATLTHVLHPHLSLIITSVIPSTSNVEHLLHPHYSYFVDLLLNQGVHSGPDDFAIILQPHTCTLHTCGE